MPSFRDEPSTVFYEIKPLRQSILDLVRFIAALSVVLYHFIPNDDSVNAGALYPVSKFGYLGVPLFFIISGYVIALSASNRSAIEFAISRFVRLYPSFWASIIVTLLSLYFITDFIPGVDLVLVNLTMLNDYFNIPNIDGVYWTLQAELKFYACIFILLLFNIFKRFEIWLSAWLAITVAHMLFEQPFFMGWFISPGYSPFFIAGVAYYLIFTQGISRYNIAILSISALAGLILGYQQTFNFIPNATSLDATISTITIFGFYVLFFLIADKRLKIEDKKVFLKLGALTYPLYLIHNEAGKALIQYLTPSLGESFSIILAIALSMIVALFITEKIEKSIASPLKRHLLSHYRKIPFLRNM